MVGVQFRQNVVTYFVLDKPCGGTVQFRTVLLSFWRREGWNSRPLEHAPGNKINGDQAAFFFTSLINNFTIQTKSKLSR